MPKNILEIIKKRFFFFLLFLPSTILVVGKTNQFFYTLTQNNKFLFHLISWLSLLLFTILFVLIFHFIEEKLGKKYLELAFRLIVVIGLILFSFFNLPYILFGNLLTYTSCGQEFNDKYILSAKSNDPSFCLDSNIELNYYAGLKGGHYCTTPNKDPVQIENFTNYCLISFAKVTNNISHCKLISSYIDFYKCIVNLDYFSGYINKQDCEKIPESSLSWKEICLQKAIEIVEEEKDLDSNRGNKEEMRKADMRKVVTAQVFYSLDEEKYLSGAQRYGTYSIGNYLQELHDPECPQGNCNNNYLDYVWLDNTKNEKKFCVYATLESKTYFAASEKGVKELDFAPTSIDCW